MIEQELIKMWQSSPELEQVRFEKSRLLLDVQSGLDRFHNSMKWLYLREHLGAIIAIPLFGYFAIQGSNIISQLAAGLIVLWAAYIMLVINKTKKKIPDQYAMSYREFLSETKDYLETQMKLRLSIFSWYVLPFLSFSYLFMLGFMLEGSSELTVIIGGGIYCMVIGVVIYFLNRRSAKKYVGPKLEKVNDLLRSLSE